MRQTAPIPESRLHIEVVAHILRGFLQVMALDVVGSGLPEGGKYAGVFDEGYDGDLALAVQLFVQVDQGLRAFLVVLDIQGERALDLDATGGCMFEGVERIQRAAEVADRQGRL